MSLERKLIYRVLDQDNYRLDLKRIKEFVKKTPQDGTGRKKYEPAPKKLLSKKVLSLFPLNAE